MHLVRAKRQTDGAGCTSLGEAWDKFNTSATKVLNTKFIFILTKFCLDLSPNISYTKINILLSMQL